MKYPALFLGGCVWACTTPAPVTPAEPTAIPPAAPTVSAVPPAPLPPQSLSRYVPSSAFKDIGGGRRAAVVSNRRIVIKNAEATVIDPKAIEDLGRPQQIPKALGGGWVFVGKHSVRYAQEFDAVLDGIASVAPPEDELDVGFGHGYVLVSAPPSAPELHAIPGGKKLPLPVPGTRQIFASPKGQVALCTDKGELHFSPGRGAPFQKLAAFGVERLAYDGKGIVVYGGPTIRRIDENGRLSPRPNETGLIVADNLAAFIDPFPDMSKPPPAPSDAERLLEPLVVVLDDDIAIAVRDEDLVGLDAHTGKEVRTRKQAFAGQANCFPIRGGTPAFVGCNGPTEMALFRIDTLDGPIVLEKKLKGVYTQDFGEPPADAPLALARRCDGSALPGAICVRQKDAIWKELPKPADPQKLLPKLPYFIHVAAAEDGSAYAFGWLDGNGDLGIVDSKQRKVRRVAKASIPKWAADGIRWQALSIVDGKLRFLLHGKQLGSAGVLEIRADDSVDAKQLAGRMAAVGKRGLLLTDRGTIEETLDAGVTFHEVPPPPGGAPDAGLFGCVNTGCTLGPWQRVGWGP